MRKPVSIEKYPKLPHSMDYRQLFEEAIEAAQLFSGDIWTDYNSHDPGVTLLEYICYAITDLGYRTNFPIADLLYARSDARPINKAHDTIIPARRIMPAAPLTVNDYRKLLIDLPEISNAIVTPIPVTENSIRGLYRVKLQLDNQGLIPPDRNQVLYKVRQFLMANRNLGEDFDEISFLQQQTFTLGGDIILGNEVLGEATAARILDCVNHYLSPTIQYRTRAEMKAQGLSLDEIYDGPFLRYGMLSEDALSSVVSVIYLAEIRDALLMVDGVHSVRNLHVLINGVPMKGDDIKIPKDTYLVLNPRMINDFQDSAPLKLLRNGVALEVNSLQIKQMYKVIVARNQKKHQASLDADTPIPSTHKRLQDIKAYFSFQRVIPSVYGLGAYGLSRDASPSRRAQARQLKGYLLIVEQFLSSFLAQLADMRDFFSANDEQVLSPTYSAQFPFDIPDVDAVLYAGQTDEAEEEIEVRLAKLLQEFDDVLDRRGRFVDHLLARFGEHFSGEVLQRMALHKFGREILAADMLKAKTRFLQNIEFLTKNRGSGFNYLQESWSEYPATDEKGETFIGNISGLKARLYSLLNLANLCNHSVLVRPELPSFKVKNKEEAAKASVKISLKLLLQFGQNKENYTILTPTPSRTELRLQINPNNEPVLVYSSRSRKKVEEALEELLEGLRKFNRESMGFFVLEHVLLRPYTKMGRRIIVTIAEDNIKLVLKSIHFHTQEEVTQISNNFLIIASNKDNLELIEYEEDGARRQILVIREGDNPILRSEPLERRITERQLKDDLLALLSKKKKKGSLSISEWITYESQDDYSDKLGADFFSHRISLILPSWPALFQRKDFRIFFQDLVARNIPAHLNVNIQWLKRQQMESFEKAFKGWLAAKREDDDRRVLDHHSQQLIKIIQGEKTFQSTKNEDQTIAADAALNQVLYEKMDYSFFLRDTELEIIEGIGPKVRRTLQQGGITTWNAISKTPASEIKKLLTTFGLGSQSSKVEDWQEQAAMAQRGTWKKLIQHQLGKSKKKGYQAKIDRILQRKFSVKPKS